MSLTAMVTALLVTKIKYYNPFIIIGGIFLSIGAGLVTFRFAVNTHLGTLILYESLLGAGVGFCIMANVVPCQTLLEEHHHSLSHGLTFLFSMLGACVLPFSMLRYALIQYLTGLSRSQYQMLFSTSPSKLRSLPWICILMPYSSYYNSRRMFAYTCRPNYCHRCLR
jgi:hypothetical protein